MSAEQGSTQMGTFARITGIFTSPKAVFESIDSKPTWLIPFIIIIVLGIVLQYVTLDIQFQDGIAKMEAKGDPVERIEMAQSQMQGPVKYIQLVAIPIVVLIFWVIYSGVFLFTGNTIMGGKGKFKTVFSGIAWSGLISTVGHLVKSLLFLAKGTTHGVTTSLAAVMPTPEIGEKGSIVYQLLAKTDIFMIWLLFVWGIGFSVIFKMSQNKSMAMVFSLWGIWIVISLSLGSLFGNMF